MGLIEPIVEWTWDVFGKFGFFGLFFLAFIESSFFPVPVEALLIPLVLADPGNFWIYALVSVIGSVLGALFGYYIGVFGKKTILERFFSKDKIEKVHNMYDKHGSLAVFIGGFTPLPYKLFTVSAGVFYINLKKFMIASFIGRGLRFFTVAFLLYIYGDRVLGFMDKYFNVTTLIVVMVLVLFYAVYVKMKSSEKVFI